SVRCVLDDGRVVVHDRHAAVVHTHEPRVASDLALLAVAKQALPAVAGELVRGHDLRHVCVLSCVCVCVVGATTPSSSGGGCTGTPRCPRRGTRSRGSCQCRVARSPAACSARTAPTTAHPSIARCTC